ncbi:hypothetical protein BTXL6_11100 [Bacillus thuringiensis]|nr:hypothetical protein BTXL6_28665 [Bacillus thuringiensis]ALL21960.1 hypothetical protein BTXL6_11100 [Bacillus thuringiensis]EEM19380.1 hypothetical protein bthur0001_55070 [Bacillus thuringiensis serovar tochigiensis BGSC 4Y1]
MFILDWKEKTFYALEIVEENQTLKIPGAYMYNWNNFIVKELSIMVNNIIKWTSLFMGKTILINNKDQE